MNRMFLIALCLFLTTIEARADFKMPASVYRMDRLDDAIVMAAAKHKPISFIYTHEKTKCPLTMAASLNAADKLGKNTIVVYINGDVREEKMLPDFVQAALDSPESGRLVPKTVIVDSDVSKVLVLVPYAKAPLHNQLLKEALKKL
jgi:hypothetical protein